MALSYTIWYPRTYTRDAKSINFLLKVDRFFSFNHHLVRCGLFIQIVCVRFFFFVSLCNSFLCVMPFIFNCITKMARNLYIYVFIWVKKLWRLTVVASGFSYFVILQWKGEYLLNWQKEIENIHLEFNVFVHLMPSRTAVVCVGFTIETLVLFWFY